MRDVNICIAEFEKFYELLMKEAPIGYTPWFFPCEKMGKNPSAKAILKINPKSEGSWHHESARLTKEQCIQHIKEGWNIGISARVGDPLVIIDIDNPEYLNQLPTNTLTATSRKRIGAHAFCWDKDGTAKINLPTDDGEIRSENQYLLSCGSYVPFNLDKKKDLEAFDKLPQEVKQSSMIGYYTLRDANIPRPISFKEVPKFFQNKQKENLETEIIIKQKDEKKNYPKDGKYTDLFKLNVSDIVGSIPANKREGHPLHDSDTDANFSLSSDGCLGHCWRHLVSLNAVQYLAVKAGYASCGDAGTPHKGRGFSKIRGDKLAIESAYQEAIKMGLIKPKESSEDEGISSSRITEEQKEYLVFSKAYNRYFPNIDKVADSLIDLHDFKTIYGKNSETIFVCNDKGYYEPTGKEVIKTSVERLLGSFAKTKDVNEVYEKIKRKTSVDKSVFENTDCNLIPTENGVYNINKKELLPHDSKYNFTFVIPHKFDKLKDCKKFIDFLNGVLYPEDIPLMQEIFGFMLYRKYFLKKGFILMGEKDTSKTTLLNIAIDFIGVKNKTSIPLQKISGSNDFTKLSLKDKHINAYDDLSARDIEDTAGFKIATGGGYISGEEKFGDYCQFMSFAKQIFATNKIPTIKDNDEAYTGRWIVIPFDNVVSNPDPFILQKILSEDEMSGILNWALEGLYRLLEKGKFSYNKSLEQTKLLMERSNPLSAFVQDILIKQDDGRITKEQMYEIYSLYANKNDYPRLSKEQLGRQLPKKASYILEKRDTERYWANVAINPKYNDKDTLDTFLEILSKPLSKNTTSNTKSDINTTKNTIGLDMFSIKASNLSEDTIDTSKEETPCMFCIEPAFETLDDIPMCKKHLEDYKQRLEATQ